MISDLEGNISEILGNIVKMTKPLSVYTRSENENRSKKKYLEKNYFRKFQGKHMCKVDQRNPFK